jgi:hypothetical protein
MHISGAVEALKRFRIALDPPIDMVHWVAQRLLEDSDTPKDYVRTWVYLFTHSVMGSPWLLQRLFETSFSEKGLRTEFRRRAGRCLHLKISETKISVENLAKYCGKFLKLGFDFGTDINPLLSRKFEDETDVRICAQALDILRETQAFNIEDYKGWYHKVGSKFEPEILEEAMKAPPHSAMEALEQRAQVKLLSKH